MKKLLLISSIIFIVVACTNKAIFITETTKISKNLQEIVDGIQKENEQGGIFIINYNKKKYLFIKDDRRNKSLLANSIEKVQIEQKNDEIKINITTKKMTVDKVEKRDALYEYQIKNEKKC